MAQEIQVEVQVAEEQGKESPMFPMSPVIGIGILIILAVISVGGFALFLKSGKPIMKWGGLFAFGIGLILLLLAFIYPAQ
jgi:hypothetical protein